MLGQTNSTTDQPLKWVLLDAMNCVFLASLILQPTYSQASTIIATGVHWNFDLYSVVVMSLAGVFFLCQAALKIARCINVAQRKDGPVNGQAITIEPVKMTFFRKLVNLIVFIGFLVAIITASLPPLDHTRLLPIFLGSFAFVLFLAILSNRAPQKAHSSEMKHE